MGKCGLEVGGCGVMYLYCPLMFSNESGIGIHGMMMTGIIISRTEVVEMVGQGRDAAGRVGARGPWEGWVRKGSNTKESWRAASTCK